METIEEKIRKYIADNILYSNNGYPYPDDTSFLENGIVDSMNVMEIVMYTEENFGIKVKDEDIVPANFDSIQNLAEFIKRRQKAVA
jgi:acyl carrier protein